MAWGVGEEGEATVPDGGEEGKGGVVEDASVEADMWQKGSWRVRNKELEDEWESEKREQGKGEIKIKTQTSNSVLRSHFVERKMSLCVCVIINCNH